jgi:hypothetical protein
MMIVRVRVPSSVYRIRLTSAGTNRRLTEVLVEALADDTIFATLMARTDPDAPPDTGPKPFNARRTIR